MMHLGIWQTWIPVMVQVIATVGAVWVALISRTDRITRRLDSQQGMLDTIRSELSGLGSRIDGCTEEIRAERARVDMLYLTRGAEEARRGEHE